MTLRHLGPLEVLDVVADAGLQCIEWGGDLHVAPGDLRSADLIRRRSGQLGLCVASYGSYYRAGHGSPEEGSAIISTAASLGAPRIRVWCGQNASQDADPQYWVTVADDVKRLADAAAEQEISIAFEYHRNTLCDVPDGARRILRAIDRNNVTTYWQRPEGQSHDAALRDVRDLQDAISGLHVFATDGASGRVALKSWNEFWQVALGIFVANSRIDAMIEFVKGNDPRQVIEDAAVLRSIVQSWEKQTQS